MAKDIIETYKAIEPINIDLQSEDKEVIAICNKASNIINDIITKSSSNINFYSSDGLSFLLSGLSKKLKIRQYIDNIDMLDMYWNIYKYICLYFGSKPTIIRFSIFTDIDRATIETWRNEEYRSSTHSSTAKKWYKECEGTLYDEVIKTGNIGCMFALKANYGYRDNVVINVNADSTGQQAKSTDEIASDLGIEDKRKDTKSLPDAEF